MHLRLSTSDGDRVHPINKYINAAINIHLRALQHQWGIFEGLFCFSS
jgi:hypothetical protein